MIDMGARLVFHGSDIVFVKNGLDQVRASFTKELGVSLPGMPGTPAQTYLETD